MKNVTLKSLRAGLRPGGTAPVVYLTLLENYYKEEFVNQCLNDVEDMHLRMAVGIKPTALERLGFRVLMDSAGIVTR